MTGLPLKHYDNVNSRLKYGREYFLKHDAILGQSCLPPGAVVQHFTGPEGLAVLVDLRVWIEQKWRLAAGLSSEYLSASDIRDCFHMSGEVCCIALDDISSVQLHDHSPVDENFDNIKKYPRIQTSLGQGWLVSLPSLMPDTSDANHRGLIPETLPLKLRLVLGTSKLKLRNLRALSCGDVLIVTELCEYIVCNNQTIGKYCSEGNHFMSHTLYDDFDEIEALINDDDNIIETGLKGLDSLKLTIEFVAHRTQLTLKELQMLRPGDALGIGIAGEKSIIIQSGGTLLGKGELVWIEGQMGVEIQEIYSGVIDGK